MSEAQVSEQRLRAVIISRMLTTDHSGAYVLRRKQLTCAYLSNFHVMIAAEVTGRSSVVRRFPKSRFEAAAARIREIHCKFVHHYYIRLNGVVESVPAALRVDEFTLPESLEKDP